jgi:hypothetical protein
LLSEILLGSLVIALKRTRPRQRFCYIVGRYSMPERGGCQEENVNYYKKLIAIAKTETVTVRSNNMLII